jgi:hypothetical protein
MNDLYVAEWPDGTISIVSAESKNDLFWKLDEEGDPTGAKISKIKIDKDNCDIHITTDLSMKKNKPKLDWWVGECHPIYNKPKKFKLGAEDIQDAFNSLTPDLEPDFEVTMRVAKQAGIGLSI